MWNLEKKKKQKTNEPLYKKRNRPTDIEKKLMVTKGERGGRKINQEYGNNRYTVLYIKQTNNKDLQ